MEFTITEVREVDEYVGKRGKAFSFYCVVRAETGEETDVKITAKRPDRWKVGDVVELTDKGYEPWGRNGIAYHVVAANKPERFLRGTASFGEEALKPRPMPTGNGRIASAAASKAPPGIDQKAFEKAVADALAAAQRRAAAPQPVVEEDDIPF